MCTEAPCDHTLTKYMAGYTKSLYLAIAAKMERIALSESVNSQVKYSE